MAEGFKWPWSNQSKQSNIPGIRSSSGAKKPDEPIDNTDYEGITNRIVSGISQEAQNRRTLSKKSYDEQLAKWRDDGMWWMDPKSNVEPNIKEYINQMPSSRDALTQGTWTQGAMKYTPAEEQNAGSFMLYGVGSEENALGLLLNPAGYIENYMGEDWKGSGEYVWNNVVNRAVQGTAIGGGWGALAGGVIGIVEGIFNWNGAIEEDRATKQAALAKYMENLKRWQEAKRRRLVSQNVQVAANNYQINTIKKKNRAASQWDRRNLFLQTVSDAIGKGTMGKKPELPSYSAPLIRG